MRWAEECFVLAAKQPSCIWRYEEVSYSLDLEPAQAFLRAGSTPTKTEPGHENEFSVVFFNILDDEVIHRHLLKNTLVLIMMRKSARSETESVLHWNPLQDVYSAIRELVDRA